MLSIKRLISGGIITNYYCTSHCRHCLYRSGPRWPHDYMDEKGARISFKVCKRLGCHLLHIGGGEPFLNVKGLFKVLTVANHMDVAIEYIETNSSWFKGHEIACDMLSKIKELGVNTLLISSSPFHLEHIPFGKVKGVVAACKEVGIKPFIWTEDFFRMFQELDPSKRYSLDELMAQIGEKNLDAAIKRYWIHPGGRALNTFFNKGMSLQNILASNPGGCKELIDTTHFHIDLYGNYVPGLCAGLAIKVDDLGRPLDPSKYVVISTLFKHGIRGLFSFAQKECGFEPKAVEYGSKCSLCYEIRSFFFGQGLFMNELVPSSHYV